MNPYNAAQTGPVCSQGSTDQDMLDELLSQNVTDLVTNLISVRGEYIHNPDKYLYLPHPNSQLCGRGKGGPSYV